MKNRNVQIPYELFFQLLQYFLMENYESEEIIRQGLERKLDTMVNRELYSKYKTAPTEEEREKYRQEYLDRRGIPELSMVKFFSDCLITGACHAPVDSRQRRGLIRRRRNVMNILAICLELKNCKGGPETGRPYGKR